MISHGRASATVLRHYRRGGLDRTPVRTIAICGAVKHARAPFAEWHLTVSVCVARVCRCRLPIAARYRRSGLTYSGELITERLPDAQLARGAAARRRCCRCCIWIAIGRCMRRFHDRGVCHADLNAHNILLGERRARSI